MDQNRPRECPYCSISFRRWGKIDQERLHIEKCNYHCMSIVMNSEESEFTCFLCLEGFQSKILAAQHVGRKHRAEMREYEQYPGSSNEFPQNLKKEKDDFKKSKKHILAESSKFKHSPVKEASVLLKKLPDTVWFKASEKKAKKVIESLENSESEDDEDEVESVVHKKPKIQEDLFNCEMCNDRLKGRDHKNCLRALHMIENEVKCKICSLEFPNRCNAVIHLVKSHLSIESIKSTKCPVNDENFVHSQKSRQNSKVKMLSKIKENFIHSEENLNLSAGPILRSRKITHQKHNLKENTSTEKEKEGPAASLENDSPHLEMHPNEAQDVSFEDLEDPRMISKVYKCPICNGFFLNNEICEDHLLKHHRVPKKQFTRLSQLIEPHHL